MGYDISEGNDGATPIAGWFTMAKPLKWMMTRDSPMTQETSLFLMKQKPSTDSRAGLWRVSPIGHGELEVGGHDVGYTV